MKIILNQTKSKQNIKKPGQCFYTFFSSYSVSDVWFLEKQQNDMSNGYMTYLYINFLQEMDHSLFIR